MQVRSEQFRFRQTPWLAFQSRKLANMSQSPAANTRNPSVKRIMQEMKEMQKEMEEARGSAQFAAEALESDIFQWQFCIRGPDGTEFEDGIYHGRILLPHDYPFKPPSFVMLTPVRACSHVACAICCMPLQRACPLVTPTHRSGASACCDACASMHVSCSAGLA